jgi:hypothetical protein
MTKQLLRATVLRIVLLCPIANLSAADPTVTDPTAAAIDLRLVAIKTGNRDSAFSNDAEKWRQTPAFGAAQAAGVDLDNPLHPLFVHSYRNSRLFFLFYNTVGEGFGDRPYLIQRIKRTIRNYSEINGGEPITTETYLVEAIKLKNGTFRPDQHFGSYALGGFQRREIIKECEIGFGEVRGLAEGTEWPFEPRKLFVMLQDYGADRSLYDKVQFSAAKQWKIVASFDQDGTYRVQVPELGIDAPNRLPDPKDADSVLAADTANLVLLEGRGVLDLVVGKSTAEKIAIALGPPLQVERASAAAHNFHHKQRLTCNVYNGGTLNTVMTRGGFAGKTSNGIGLRDSRQQVIERYGQTETRGNTLTYPGVIFHLDGENRVSQIVIFAAR